jgi:hypothetical protein
MNVPAPSTAAARLDPAASCAWQTNRFCWTVWFGLWNVISRRWLSAPIAWVDDVPMPLTAVVRPVLIGTM